MIDEMKDRKVTIDWSEHYPVRTIMSQSIVLHWDSSKVIILHIFLEWNKPQAPPLTEFEITLE